MTSKAFDTAEVLFNHIDLVTARLDQIGMFLNQVAIKEEFKSKRGQEIVNYVRDNIKILTGKGTQKYPSNVKKFLAEYKAKLSVVAQNSDYIVSWARSTREILLKLCENSVELDIRWNYLFSIRFCQLFNMLSKIIFFFFHFSHLRAIAVLGAITDPKPQLTNNILEVYRFGSSCATSPFQMLETKEGIFASHLGQLISQVGPFLIQVLGQWPLIDWQDFDIFTQTQTQPDSTLPNLEHIILSNLTCLTEMSYFFLLSYPDFVKKHLQFKALMNELFSESYGISLSRTVIIPFIELHEAYQKWQNAPLVNLEQIKYQLEIKEQISHPQRITHLLVLLKGVVRIVEFNPMYAPKLTHEITALTSFSSYELSIVFENINTITNESIELLNMLVTLVKVYIMYSTDFSRFLIFNLGSIDCSYLAQLNQQFSSGSLPWQQSFTAYLGDLLYDLQTTVDLEEFDKGTRYDFTPFLYTHGRLCLNI
ncbi:hypothetical protein GPJ56_006713 [Histomonas meleagridis]|uniref:uncharacterized protein n=1 Tax=Histomonas meleagridis TaxID=135588 RepID=UPI0035594B61|nr:hypothetical protein GPJ56_006713 [Histomonas meleagridis]KAH0806458.1 hypothetical protein GO595_000620 [Histomonas meleagridis]